MTNRTIIPTLFISYSTKDNDIVRELVTFLEHQTVEIWDYTNNNMAIPVGSDIPTELQARINSCDFFIPIISTNSVSQTTGKFTTLEVAYAINIGLLKTGKIIPIAIKDRLPPKWNDTYAALENLRYLALDINNERQFINTIINLCKSVGIEFQPFTQAHPKLPLLKLFQNEVRNFTHKVSEQNFLAEIVGVFSIKYKNEQWLDCLKLINYLIDTCYFFMPGYHCFYPYIVRAVCQRHLDLLTDAEQSYKKAMQVRELDENVFAGLAGVYNDLGDFYKAKLYAKWSLNICSTTNNVDEIINYTISLVQLEEIVPDKYYDIILNLHTDDFEGKESILLNLKGALYYTKGLYQNAINLFIDMEVRKIADTTTIGYHLNSLLALSKKNQAKVLINNALDWSIKNPNIDKYIIMQYAEQVNNF